MMSFVSIVLVLGVFQCHVAEGARFKQVAKEQVGVWIGTAKDEQGLVSCRHRISLPGGGKICGVCEAHSPLCSPVNQMGAG